MTARLPMPRMLRVFTSMSALFLLAQCSGTVLNPSEDIVEAAIGPKGGILRLPLAFPGSAYQEATLVIPPGALTQQVVFSMRRGADIPAPDATTLGPSIEIQPEGLQFQQPATLRVPFDSSSTTGKEALVQGLVQTQDQLELLPAANLGQPAGLAELSLSHLSTYQIILTKPPGMPMFTGVTLLFVIDNSLSMTAKQRKLAESIGLLFTQFVKLANTAMPLLKLRVGVTTTDVDSNYVAGTPDCGKPQSKFDNGRLQIRSCLDRVAKGEISAEAGQACMEICKAGTGLPTAANPYIEYDPATKKYNVGDQSQEAAIAAFQCMALVGDSGCNIEGPLEAMSRTLLRVRSGELNSFLPLNMNHRSADSLLAVFFITDEDDCSVRTDRMHDNQLATRSCPSNMSQTPDCFNIDYRCIAESLDCGPNALLTPGDKGTCKVREQDSYLEPTGKYFKVLEDIVVSLDQVVISGIWTLPMIQTGEDNLKVLVKPGDQQALSIGYSAPTSPQTTPNLHQTPACTESYIPAMGPPQVISGMPQLRLSKFACYLGGALQVSICDLAHYGDALDQLVAYITKTTTTGPTETLNRCTALSYP